MKVLIVDDDNDIQDLIALEMKKAKIDYKQASSVDEAVALLREEFFDCMFLDIVLGEESTSQGVVQFLAGPENIYNINIPIILMSAYMNDAAKERFKHKRFTIFETVQKPFTKGQLSGLANSVPKKNVLILDDDEDIVDLLANELKKPGYRVIQALNCEQAINNLKHEHVLCFFVDIVIGEGTSNEVIKYIADNKEEMNLNFPLILMSGRMTKDQMDKIQINKVDIFKTIQKPFKKGEILSYVQTIEGVDNGSSPEDETFKGVFESAPQSDGTENVKGSWAKDNDGTESVKGAISDNDDGTERVKGGFADQDDGTTMIKGSQENLDDGTERVKGSQDKDDDGTELVSGSVEKIDDDFSRVKGSGQELEEINRVKGSKEDSDDNSAALIKGTDAEKDDNSSTLVKGTDAEKEDNSSTLVKGTDAEKEDNSSTLVKGTDAEKEDNSSTLVKGTEAEKEDNSSTLVKGTEHEKEDNSGTLIKGTEHEKEDNSGTLIKGTEHEKEDKSAKLIKGGEHEDESEGVMRVKTKMDSDDVTDASNMAFAENDIQDSSSNIEMKNGVKESVNSSGEKIVEIQVDSESEDFSAGEEVAGKKYERNPDAAKKMREMAKKQLEFFNKKELNTRNKNGMTSLMVAALCGQVDICRNLLEAGAQLSLKSKDGKTALHYAVRSKSVQTVYFLLEQGARVNDRDDKSIEPLYEAVKHGDNQMIKYLIEQGARLSARVEGENYLFIAARAGDAESFITLFEAGVDIHTRNFKGQSVIDIAKQKKKINILRAIKALHEKSNEEKKKPA